MRIQGKFFIIGYANFEAVKKTLETRLATFYSTSRKKLWTKGETSGDFLRLKEMLVDCDQDALVYKVNPIGGACHTKVNGVARQSCFYRRISGVKKLEYIE